MKIQYGKTLVEMTESTAQEYIKAGESKNSINCTSFIFYQFIRQPKREY